MLVLPLISLVAFYLLKKTIEYDSPQREGRIHLAINLVFIVGVYLLASSYGNHEVTNYLHTRFCINEAAGPLCDVVIFNDDEFSHWVFFTGFAMMNAALLFLQNFFIKKTYSKRCHFADCESFSWYRSGKLVLKKSDLILCCCFAGKISTYFRKRVDNRCLYIAPHSIGLPQVWPRKP
jgi:hypothetical protein